MPAYKEKLSQLLDRDIIIIVILLVFSIPAFLLSFRGSTTTGSNNYCKPIGATSGSDEVKVYVSKAGNYSIWLRIESPMQINFNDLPDIYNPLLVNVDNKNCFELGGSITIPLNSWVWVNSLNGSQTNNFRIYLSKETHFFYISGSYLSIDRLELVANACVPQDLGSNCIAQNKPVVNIRK